MIVMAKPILVTMVIEVPLSSAMAFCATKVENSGESAITATLQISKNEIRIVSEGRTRINGDNKQHTQDTDNAIVATFFKPYFCEINPLPIQAKQPVPMTINESNGMFKVTDGCWVW